jgi:protein-L-isoaspartate(D-aspartate) O-methyltransferase
MNSELRAYRDFYARYVVASSGGSNERLIAAFGDVAREDFLGNGPWLVWTGAGYLSTPSSDPRYVYQDVVIGLMPEKKINNGQPTLHARCLTALNVAPGATVAHVGAGTGYYTAILAKLAGPAGEVHAYEMEEALAARATELLRGFSGVEVERANATEHPLPAVDALYVNAGVTDLPDRWLDALNVGGRLLAPLTPNEGYGGMLLVTRVASDAYAAQIVARVSFVHCAGSRSDAQSAALVSAFEPGRYKPVKSLRRHVPPDESAWYVGTNWWLSTRDPDAHALRLASGIDA